MSNLVARAIRDMLVVSLLVIAGCTFDIHNQSPDQSNTLTPFSEPIPAKIGLRRLPEQGQSPCGDTFQKFVDYLRQQRVFSELLYEIRPSDAPDFVFSVQFDCEVDPHLIKNNLIGLVEGPLDLTPLALQTIDWIINATVVVYRRDQIVKHYEVVSHFVANINLWGRFQRSKYLEAFRKAEEYTYEQLVSRWKNIL